MMTKWIAKVNADGEVYGLTSVEALASKCDPLFEEFTKKAGTRFLSFLSEPLLSVWVINVATGDQFALLPRGLQAADVGGDSGDENTPKSGVEQPPPVGSSEGG